MNAGLKEMRSKYGPLQDAFKAGDRVICIKPNPDDDAPNLLKEGEVYIVRANSISNSGVVLLEGKKGGYFPFRFRLIEKTSAYRRIVL
jgi:hypothetical protein